MSHHLQKKGNGHLLRVDRRIYEQGYVIDVPTHLLRGTDKETALFQDRAWSIGAGKSYSPYVSSNKTDYMPTYAEVVSSIETSYSANAPSATWIQGGSDSWTNLEPCANSRVWSSWGPRYRYEFMAYVRFYSFAWPSGYNFVPGICFTVNTTFQNKGLSSVCFRAFSCDRIYAGGTQTQPRYTYNPKPTTLAELDALPGGYIIQDALSSTEITIMGPFSKKDLLTVVAYPCGFDVPYQVPSPPSWNESYFEGYAKVGMVSSTASSPSAWVVG